MNRWLELYKKWGLSFFPLKERDKKPDVVNWKEYQKRKPSEEEVKRWVEEGHQNFGVVCGKVSGDLLVIDIDKEELFSKLNIGELASSTYTVKTGKGYHLYLRIAEAEGENLYKSLEFDKKEEVRFQNEGHYAVIAGSIHPTGSVYEHFATSPLEIKTASKGLLDEIERRWKKFHGLDKIEEKEKVIKWKTERSRGIEEFKKRVNITKVISRYVEPKVSFGSYWQGHCPFHDDKTPSFTVYEGSGHYFCFGCSAFGDVITFIREAERCDFISAIKKIQAIAGIEYFPEEVHAGVRQRRIRPSDIEEIIMEMYKFITIRDNEEMFYYNGGVWRFDGEVVVKEMVERIMKELGMKDSASIHFTKEVIGHIQRETYIDREILNKEVRKVNLSNAVFDLQSMELLPQSPHFYFTYLVPVTYDPEAECPMITRFLNEVLSPGDIQPVLEFIGYCLIPEMRYHKAVMLLGFGSNGKSTFIELIRQFLGVKNTTAQSLHALINDKFAAASLYGRLANLYADITSESLRHTGVFKILTGNDTTTAQKKFRDSFEFHNTAKLIFSANELPMAYDDTNAFFRRWILINFPNTFDGDRCDVNLLEKLITPQELSGFLNLVISALISLLEKGKFMYSKTTDQLREDYIMKSNPIAIFVQERLVQDVESFETKEEVYSNFAQYCREKNLPIIDKAVFGRRLSKYILVRSSQRTVRGKRTTCWDGIILKNKEDFEPVEEGQDEEIQKKLEVDS